MTVTTLSAHEMLNVATKQRQAYSVSILRNSSYETLLMIANVLHIDLNDPSYRGSVEQKINTYLDRQIGIACYHLQQEDKARRSQQYQTQPIAEKTHAPSSQHVETRLTESQLDTLVTRLENVSGKHQSVYQHIATTMLCDTYRARESHVDVIAHVLFSLKMRACAAHSQQLRTCMLRVIAVIEGN